MRSHAVYAYVQMSPSATSIPSPMRLPGLDPSGRYRIAALDELASAKEFGRVRPEWMLDELTVPGAQLVERGLQVPVLYPESVLLIEARLEDPHG